MLVKTIHVTTVSASIILFSLRYLWMLRDSPRLQSRTAKIVPHVNDTVLFLSAIALAWQTHQYPFVNQWITVKIFALLGYIILGSITLNRQYRKPQRVVTGLAAIGVYGFMISVAVTKNPLGFFAS